MPIDSATSTTSDQFATLTSIHELRHQNSAPKMSDAETLAANREIYNACIKSSKDIHFAVAAADLFIALAFGVSVESAKAAAGYCAFEVAVKAPFGKPLSGVPVTLVKGNPW